MPRSNQIFLCALASLALLSASADFTNARAQGTAFTYQGQLQSTGRPASGNFNLTFSLFSASTNGLLIAGPVTNNGVTVTNGLFSTPVDFGSSAFMGATNWLEIAVEPINGSAFITLIPRQQLTPVPNAIFAEGANAAGLTGIVPITALGGTYNLSTINATNYGYAAKWVTNSYSMSTNDTILFCWGTNQVLTLPITAPFTKIFTVFSKNPNGSVMLTNGSGAQTITVPGSGQALAVMLGASTSPSNVVTVTFDGANY